MRKMLLIICSLLWICLSFPSYAQSTAYEAQILDEGDIILYPYLDNIQAIMSNLTEHGNVVYLTTLQKLDDPAQYAKERYTELYGEEDGVLLLVVENTNQRYASIYTSGIFCDIDTSLEDIIQKASSNVAQDNLVECARTTFHSIYKALPVENLGMAYTNEITGYEAKILDDTDSLIIIPSTSLARIIRDLTNYGNVLIAIAESHTPSTPLQYAEVCYAEHFGAENGILLLLDLQNDVPCLYSQGFLTGKLDDSTTDTIVADEAYYFYEEDYESYIEYTLEFLLYYLDATFTFNTYNPDTGYYLVIDDDAELLPAAQKMELMEIMYPITTYGNVAFVSTDYAPYSTENAARGYYSNCFGTDSGTLFLIDMDNRYIWIHSDGAIYKTVNKGYANTITDNAYSLASDGDYYGCAVEVYSQILTLLKGGTIAQPMKYICNTFLGIIIALTINFSWMAYCAYLKRPKNKELLTNVAHSFSYHSPKYIFTKKTQTERSSGSGGGGRVGGFSGGRGGGGRSGGGGGHRF